MSESRRPSTRLTVRTPASVVLDESVRSVTAEDGSGRFGVRPRCEPLLAFLVPGLLTYREDSGRERFVAVGRGVLRAERDRVQVAVREAVPCDSLDEVRREVVVTARRRSEGEAAMSEMFHTLYRGLLTTLVEGERLS